MPPARVFAANRPLARYLLDNARLTSHRKQRPPRVDIVLRISQSKSITLATLNLDGKLLGPWVDEVRTIVAGLHAEESVRLNLQGLSFADPNGIALLQELRRSGVELAGCSALIAGMLASYPVPAAAGSAPPRAPGRAHD